MVNVPAILLALACVDAPAIGAADEGVRVSVDVAFAPDQAKNWRLWLDGGGRVWGDVEDVRFSAAELPAGALREIRGLARCVMAVPEPRFPAPPISDTAEPLPPFAILKVRIGAKSRKVFIAPNIAVGPGVQDAWPAIKLLLLLRGLVADPRAYDYRAWLHSLARRKTETRCPWLTE
jgi:hypothetical protein